MMLSSTKRSCALEEVGKERMPSDEDHISEATEHSEHWVQAPEQPETLVCMSQCPVSRTL